MYISNISSIEEKVEVSGLWLNSNSRGNRILTYEGAYLIFKQVFEDWLVNRLEIRTDSRNKKAINLYKNMGATEEGLLRQNGRTQDGVIGNTVVFSVLKNEWVPIKSKILQILTLNNNENGIY